MEQQATAKTSNTARPTKTPHPETASPYPYPVDLIKVPPSPESSRKSMTGGSKAGDTAPMGEDEAFPGSRYCACCRRVRSC